MQESLKNFLKKKIHAQQFITPLRCGKEKVVEEEEEEEEEEEVIFRSAIVTCHCILERCVF